MKQCRITVMRVARYDDLIAQYENPIQHACDMTEGQVFLANGWEKPAGFCQSAWDTLSPFVLALSHGAELLILDEATSGLDPIVRDEVLDLLLDFVQDERHGVLVSSHITSDLEKVADYITFLHQGKLVFTLEKDLLGDQYGVLHCGAAGFDTLDPADILAWRREAYQYKVLVRDRYQAEKKYPQALVSPAAIEDTMLFYVKGEVS